ncbi:MAG: flavin reductase family protein [Actinophytocola sp.]|uniref:flavin reductase family protein n=1 Tax=Actinophytocola sp. TaxID=1872138 RepID=UPI001326A277|nr:flavin reductase family protein [Actinophytocola sp.]MPZ83026.1 flavin reductase family protein [Actinophytocola sp.]
MHRVTPLKVLYFGTPVVLISSRNEDGSANLAPMSSAWWLGQSCMLGLGDASQTSANLRRARECVLNLAPSTLVDAVDRLALLTARPDVPAYKVAKGYTYSRTKFAAAGLTEQPSDLVSPPRAAECPIQLECVLDAAHPMGSGTTAFQVSVVRAHVAVELLIPEKNHVDPLAWDPLIMKFCEFFGGGENIHPSQLATGWQMPHALPQPA